MEGERGGETVARERIMGKKKSESVNSPMDADRREASQLIATIGGNVFADVVKKKKKPVLL